MSMIGLKWRFIHWKCALIAGLCLGLMFAALLLLIYPNNAIAKPQKGESPNAIDEGANANASYAKMVLWTALRSSGD